MVKQGSFYVSEAEWLRGALRAEEKVEEAMAKLKSGKACGPGRMSKGKVSEGSGKTLAKPLRGK